MVGVGDKKDMRSVLPVVGAVSQVMLAILQGYKSGRIKVY